jgi:hypothetical protein
MALLLTISLVLAALALSACGSGRDTTTAATTTRPAVSRETADHLAKLSDRVASDLDSGETCSAAYAADTLKSAVESSDLPSTIRPDVGRVVEELVNQVNCPPPPPPPEPEPKKKPKEQDNPGPGNSDHAPGHNKGHGPDHPKPGHSDHGGVTPPGQGGDEG